MTRPSNETHDDSPLVPPPVGDGTPPGADDTTDLVAGLSQPAGKKLIPTRFSYSDEGSRLFEVLCEQPDYYLTRVERSILEQNDSDIMSTLGSCDFYELGSGNSRKTAVLLRAASRLELNVDYYPTDVNEWVLRKAKGELATELPGQPVNPMVATYDEVLATLAATRGVGERPRVVSFFGGSFGNFRAAARMSFLERVARALAPGDSFLLASDLDKPGEILEAAYNDRAGTLRAMELNVLTHLNTLFDGDFDTTQFEHTAFHNRDELRIESCVRSLRDQRVRLRGLDLEMQLTAGELICNDVMWKPTPEALDGALLASGLRVVRTWGDSDEWYTLRLLQRS